MKYLIDIDDKSLEWLKSLIGNSVARTRQGTEPSYYSAWEFLEGVDTALNEMVPYKEINTIADLPGMDLPKDNKKNKSNSKSTSQPVEDVYSCSKHPNYHGLRATSNDCDECWDLYKTRQGHAAYELAKRKFDMKKNKK